MAGISVGAGWVAHPTPKALARWDRLNVPRLGEWTESQHAGLAGLPRPPAARYPSRVEPNVVYWPTHLGGFAFGWFFIRKADLLVPKPTWFHPSLQVPNYLWLHLFPEGPLPQHFPPGGFDIDAGPLVGMWGLAEYALSVLGDGEELWAVPCVDDRFFWREDYRDGLDPGGLGSHDAESRYYRLKDLVTNSYYNPGQGQRGLSYMGLGQNFPLEVDGPEFDSNFPVDLAPLTRARASAGDLADCALGMMGLRGCFSPPAYGDYPRPRGQDFARASASLDAWFADPRVQLRDGSPPGLSPDPPFALGNVRVDTTDGGSWAFAASELLTGVGPSNHTIALGLPVRLTRDTQSFVEHPKAQEAARRMAASLLAWPLRPFMARTAGAVRGCDSALVGMWEFHNGATVAHGLTWDTWWSGGPVPRPDAATVRITSGGPRIGAMSEATTAGGQHLYSVGSRDDNTPVNISVYSPLRAGAVRRDVEYAAVATGATYFTYTTAPASLGEYGGVAPPLRPIAMPTYEVVGEAWEYGLGLVNELAWQQFASPKGFPGGVGIGPRQQVTFGQLYPENSVLLSGVQGYGVSSAAWLSAPGPQNGGLTGGSRGVSFTALNLIAGGPAVGLTSATGGQVGFFDLPPPPGQFPTPPGGYGIGCKGTTGYFGRATTGHGVSMDNLDGPGTAESTWNPAINLGGPSEGWLLNQPVGGSGLTVRGYFAALSGYKVPLRGMSSGAAEGANGWGRGKTAAVPAWTVGTPPFYGNDLGPYPPDGGRGMVFVDGLYIGGGGNLVVTGMFSGPAGGETVNVLHGGTGNTTLTSGELLTGDGTNPVVTVNTLRGGTF